MLLRMGCSYGAMLSGSLGSFFSHFLFLCISIGLIATTLYNNISLFSALFIGRALQPWRDDVDSRGTGIRGSNHSSLPIPFLRAFPPIHSNSHEGQYYNSRQLGSPRGVPAHAASPLHPLPYSTQSVTPHAPRSPSAGAYVAIV